jgi:hypothetical protein
MPEYPALLPGGLHPMSLGQLRELCVAPFKDRSRTRENIMAGLEAVISRLQRDGVGGDLWVNGSFLTQKIDPSDSDVVLFIDGDALDQFTTQQDDTLVWLESEERKATHMCDAYADAKFPPGHQDEWIGAALEDYWRRTYGKNGGGRKGIAVIRLGPSHG